MSPLTKVVLHVWSDGTCSLLTVPMAWDEQQPVPDDVVEERFETADAAMIVLAELGRTQNPATHTMQAVQVDAPDETAEATQPEADRPEPNHSAST